MSEQLTLDLDPNTTAELAARDAAFEELVQTRTVTVAEAVDHDLYYRQALDESVMVWVCPACGTWEPNEFLLANNHGIERGYLVQMDNGEWVTAGANYGRLWCVALDLTASHATYADGHLHECQKAMVAQLRPEVRDVYEYEVATGHVAVRPLRDCEYAAGGWQHQPVAASRWKADCVMHTRVKETCENGETVTAAEMRRGT